MLMRIGSSASYRSGIQMGQGISQRILGEIVNVIEENEDCGVVRVEGMTLFEGWARCGSRPECVEDGDRRGGMGACEHSGMYRVVVTWLGDSGGQVGNNLRGKSIVRDRDETEVVRDALIGKRLSLDLTFPIGFDCAFMKAFIEESKESTQSRAEKGGAKCRDKATEDSDFLLANRAQYKRMELNLPLKKDICLTQAFRSHFLLKEDRKKLKVEKEGSDVYEQNEPQIEKADQGELQLQLSIGVLRWERK
ncbi:hypothetical protein Tco_0736297 [Tanacetum coccineum]